MDHALMLIVFVCWDKDLIPPTLSEPAEYPGGKEPVSFKPITSEDRIEYFARYTSASLGRVKKLFLGWARHNGPLSSQCQELNRLFSLCVDANKITVPDHLKDPPPPADGQEPFILDLLHEAASAYVSRTRKVKSQTGDHIECDSLEALEAALCDGAAISTFELAKIAFRWCKFNRVDFGDMINLIDLQQLSHDERLWLLHGLPPMSDTPSLILNGLLQSHILSPGELHPYRLDYQGMRWKNVFRSDQVRLGNLFETMGRCFELFERKLLVLRINERLSIVIYIPQKIHKEDDFLIGDTVRLFAFPQSHPDETGHRRLVSTKVGYRLYYDNTKLELYNNHRRDTFVFLNHSQNDESSYKGVQGAGNRARARAATINEGINYEWRASIALGKFSSGLQRQIGRVNREGILAAVSMKRCHLFENI
jgi:RNA dependent RNA polymerase